MYGLYGRNQSIQGIEVSLPNCGKMRMRKQSLEKGKRSQECNRRVREEEKQQAGAGGESCWGDSFDGLAILL